MPSDLPYLQLLNMRFPEFILRHGGKIAIAFFLVVLTAWFIYVHRGYLDRETIEAIGGRLPVGWVILAYLFLPLLGFPVSILLVMVGLRLGMGWGMATVALGLLLQHYIAFYLTHKWFRNRLRSFFERKGVNIPEIKKQNQIWFTVVFVSVKGPPYFAKLYLLALTDIPFRIYLWVGASTHILFSLVPVTAGAAVGSFDQRWLYAAIALAILLFLAGIFLKKYHAVKSSESKTST